MRRCRIREVNKYGRGRPWEEKRDIEKVREGCGGI